MLKLTEYYKELELNGEIVNWEDNFLTDFYNFLEEKGVSECISGIECRELITSAGGSKYLLPEWATINLAGTGD